MSLESSQFSTNAAYFDVRILLWQNSVKLIKESPIIGIEAEEKKTISPEKGRVREWVPFRKKILHAYMHSKLDVHNGYLKLAEYYGVPFLFLTLLIIYSLYKTTRLSLIVPKFVILIFIFSPCWMFVTESGLLMGF